MGPRNAFEGVSTESKQDLIVAKLVELKTELAEKLEAGQSVVLSESSLSALEQITATLDASSLAALENVTVGGSVSLDGASLLALEQITATLSGPVALDAATLEALESVTATLSGTVVVNSELPDPVAQSDGAANPTIPIVGGYASAFNGSSWDRVRSGGMLSGTGKLAVVTGVSVLTSLNAVTGVGPGVSQNFGAALQNWALQVVHSGSPTAVKVRFELSLNGVNWSLAGVWDMAAGPQTNGDIVSVINRPATYARATLETLSGGTSPAVSAFITGVP